MSSIALDYSSQFIGYRMAWSGVLLCIWTYFIQPKILKRFPNRELIIILQLSLGMYPIFTCFRDTNIILNIYIILF